MHSPSVSCVFFVLFCGAPAIDGSYAQDQCRTLEFRTAQRNGKRLINHVVRVAEVLNDGHCRTLCYTEPNCVSYNFKVEASQTGHHECELNNCTRQGHEDELTENQFYVYHEAENACVSNPCKNNGICQTGFTHRGYRCLCTAGFSGHDCQKAPFPTYTTIGCFQDHNSPAIPTLERQDAILDRPYQSRKDPTKKCFKAAKVRGFHIFAVQNGGWCASAPDAHETFNKYGKSTACRADGEGGPWANQVYYITGFNSIGCYKDTSSNPAIGSLEGTDPILDGSYHSRENPIAKCAVAAMRKGYSMFAVQDGGHCKSNATAAETYKKHGPSTACRSDGEGGSWANHVYSFA